jgi:23S rRNA (guanosine2251-2'-O)-methyltransferase
MSRDVVLIAHNIRSTHNVGSILRTCDGFGVTKVYLTGYTPYPKVKNDKRLPHIAEKLNKQINKTALGAEETVSLNQHEDVQIVIKELKEKGYIVAALEQSADSTNLPNFNPPKQIAILLGEEVNGIEKDLMKFCDLTLEIPMFGKKESFNVSVAAAIVLYELRFHGNL